MDGLTGGLQDKMRGDHKTKFSPMMFFMNFWSAIFLMAVVLVMGEIWTFIAFVQQHPTILHDVFWFSILSALGQVISDFEIYLANPHHLAAVYFPHGCGLWSFTLLCRNNNQKIFHCFSFNNLFRQSRYDTAVDRYCPCLPWNWIGQYVWKVIKV